MGQIQPRKTVLDEFFRDFPFGYSMRPLHGDPLPSPSQIKVEIKDNPDSLRVEAEVPGVNRDDIDVTIDGNRLTIRAEIRQYDADTEDEKVLHSERYYGSVQRSFTLPSDIQKDSAKADYRDGVLVLTLPKIKPGSAKRIPVN